MKLSKHAIHTRSHRIPELRFEEQNLTSYAGVVIFQTFFQSIHLSKRLGNCFKRNNKKRGYGLRTIVLTLIVHIMLGNRRLRELDYYRDDPLVKRLLSLRKMPDVSTISRTLSSADENDLQRLIRFNRALVSDRLRTEKLARLTLDFDGSIQSTSGHAEGTAVGFNKKKKGARSYYPLFCTVAQTGQVFDHLHRPGNVHDSRGARGFMLACFEEARKACPGAILESRVDSAFFSDEIVSAAQNTNVLFTVSVPFERFVELKGMIEERTDWTGIDETWSYFERSWKPQSWDRSYRFLFIRQKHKKIKKGPLQLDLFEPIDHEYCYKVIVTNKTCSAASVLKFHNGRGTQEGIFAECKQYAAAASIPFKRKLPNQIHLTSSLIAHNLGRELQMRQKPRDRHTTAKRSPLWIFDSLGTLCRRLIQRAGRLTNNSGTLVLTMSGNKKVQEEIKDYLKKNE